MMCLTTERSADWGIFATSDNSPFIQYCRQQAESPGERANAMFRGGAFHDMKAMVTYIYTFSCPLWFKKLVWHWRE